MSPSKLLILQIINEFLWAECIVQFIVPHISNNIMLTLTETAFINS